MLTSWYTNHCAAAIFIFSPLWDERKYKIFSSCRTLEKNKKKGKIFWDSWLDHLSSTHLCLPTSGHQCAALTSPTSSSISSLSLLQTPPVLLLPANRGGSWYTMRGGGWSLHVLTEMPPESPFCLGTHWKNVFPLNMKKEPVLERPNPSSFNYSWCYCHYNRLLSPPPPAALFLFHPMVAFKGLMCTDLQEDCRKTKNTHEFCCTNKLWWIVFTGKVKVTVYKH